MAKQESARQIVINPVTRIEGHAKITLQLGDDGSVLDARFHVDEFRGFEKFCEGRMYTEMPSISPRICGICPVSHAVSSVKACEMIMQLVPAPAGDRLRRLVHLGQMVSSHALSFFHLSSPDFLFGFDADPAKRNILAIAQEFPDLALRGIRLRKFGQEISERITGKKIHITGIVPGGMAYPLTSEHRDALAAWIPEAMETVRLALKLYKDYYGKNRAELNAFANFETAYLGTVGPDGELELYDGKLRWVDANGNILADQIPPEQYLEYIAERPISWSYLKYPYFKPLGFEMGFYQVGPLGRLNVASRMKTPGAQAEFETFRAMGGGRPVHGVFHHHYARLIEAISSVEEIAQLLEHPDILATETQTHAPRNRSVGVGSSEAPRGTLFHHYVTDEGGRLQQVNLLIATGQNNPAMNRSILEVARKYVDGADVREGALNRVEAAIRCFDPCLSCSTHAIGSMPMAIEIVDARGRVIREVRRHA